MPRNDGFVGSWIFFGNDFDRGEIRCESRAADLIGLLGMIAFGHQDDPVAGGEIAEGLFDVGKELDFLLGYGAGEANHALTFFFTHWLRAETFKTGNKRASEAGQAVAMRENGFAFDGV